MWRKPEAGVGQASRKQKVGQSANIYWSLKIHISSVCASNASNGGQKSGYTSSVLFKNACQSLSLGAQKKNHFSWCVISLHLRAKVFKALPMTPLEGGMKSLPSRRAARCNNDSNGNKGS